MDIQSPIDMCERCDGLCCRVYDIVDSSTGIFVKRGDRACDNFDTNNRCRIYTSIPEYPGYRESCHQYDCMEGGPIVTILARRIPESSQKYAIISSILETIRLKVVETPTMRYEILDFVEKCLDAIQIDEKLLLSIKVARVKIERWESN